MFVLVINPLPLNSKFMFLDYSMNIDLGPFEYLLSCASWQNVLSAEVLPGLGDVFSLS